MYFFKLIFYKNDISKSIDVVYDLYNSKFPCRIRKWPRRVKTASSLAAFLQMLVIIYYDCKLSPNDDSQYRDKTQSSQWVVVFQRSIMSYPWFSSRRSKLLGV